MSNPIFSDFLFEKIVLNPDLHCRWLNTLSMMENSGARKIIRSEHPVRVTELILKHAAEEARHAYFLKKQIRKILENACPTYEQEYLLAPKHSAYYLDFLDLSVCRYLKRNFGFAVGDLKYAAYLLVTYAIEVRAESLYAAYQDVLSRSGCPVNVKGILAEEEGHLQEMKSMIQACFSEPSEVCNAVCEMEEQLFNQWLVALSAEIHMPVSR